MARIETSTNLIGKTITLLDGTKAKITGAIASGYQHDKGTKRIPTRCVVKKGSGFAEIEKLPMSQLTDTGEGYVERKATAAKPAAKTSKAAKTTKVAAKTPRAAKTEKAVKPSRKAKAAEEPAEPRTRVRRKKSAAAEPVMIQAVDEDFATSLAQRLFEHLKDNELLRLNTDNATPVANDYDLKYGVEFAEPNMIHVTLGIEYAMPQPEPEAGTDVELDDAVVARAAKKVGKTVGKKLAAAIKKAYGIPAAEFLPGTVLSLNEAQFIYCGPSKDDADTAYLYSAETDKFRPVTSVNLSKYELVMDDEEAEEEEEEEEEDEEEEDVADDSSDEYTYVSVTKQHLADVSKSVTAKYHQKMADMWGIDADVLVPGLVLSDGETTFAYVGFNSKGALIVIDPEDGELMIYKKADVDTLTDFAAVIGDEGEEEAEDDAEEEEDGDDEEEEEEEEEGEDDDFDFSDDDNEDFSDLNHDELVDKVTELGLAKPRAAAKMSEEDLRELLSN
ncbi:hypothetical protein pEaSNUABM5_00330 [Erwinia phage pEa_SNUABM_5]|uniref:Uncharacterized protein n=1 Tax=Erwinia phage pEa_SNUABM_5 TaxID=2797313 RepID=A0A7T8EPV2_9CAUD|nr:hypothetical protein MPK73_gp330 [Erwinia phage pEa_SNUABM_5]QQO90472.1 hypothetical protein pEaSNUABM5_00330 [Erwinia phage pEa_SNUABM_5]